MKTQLWFQFSLISPMRFNAQPTLEINCSSKITCTRKMITAETQILNSLPSLILNAQFHTTENTYFWSKNQEKRVKRALLLLIF